MSDATAFAARATRHGDVLQVKVSGELDLATEPQLVAAVTENLGPNPAPRIVVDLTDLAFMDSSGLRGLLRCRDAAVRQQITFAICLGENLRIARVLRISGVEAWFGYE